MDYTKDCGSDMWPKTLKIHMFAWHLSGHLSVCERNVIGSPKQRRDVVFGYDAIGGQFAMPYLNVGYIYCRSVFS